MKKLIILLLIVGCITEPEDCAGVAGGTAVLDDCGVCDAIDAYLAGSCYDCAGDANGTAIEDCLGVCGGDAVEDECGECGGSGPEENYDCEGNCIVGFDCRGVCGGGFILDCNSHCITWQYIGDGICDDGNDDIYDLYCAEFEYDNGDCDW